MAGLQRSVATFRRSGSSGLVWDDSLFLEKDNGEFKKEEKENEFRDLRPARSMGFLSKDIGARARPSSGLPPLSKSSGNKVLTAIRKALSTKQYKANNF